MYPLMVVVVVVAVAYIGAIALDTFNARRKEQDLSAYLERLRIADAEQLNRLLNDGLKTALSEPTPNIIYRHPSTKYLYWMDNNGRFWYQPVLRAAREYLTSIHCFKDFIAGLSPVTDYKIVGNRAVLMEPSETAAKAPSHQIPVVDYARTKDVTQPPGKYSNEAYLAMVQQIDETLKESKVSPEPDWSVVYKCPGIDVLFWFDGKRFHSMSPAEGIIRPVDVNKEGGIAAIRDGRWVRSEDHVLIEKYGAPKPEKKYKPVAAVPEQTAGRATRPETTSQS